MFDALIDFFESFIGMFSTIFDFLISIVEDIVFVTQLTGSFVVNIPNYFRWLPSECVVIVVAIFGIVCMYKILGREG